MPLYDYIDQTGQTKQVEANDPTSAMSSAQGIAPNSGVMLNQTTPGVDSSATTMNDIYSSFNAPSDSYGSTKSYNDYQKDYEVDEKKIRKEVLDRYQGEIDSVKDVYGRLLREQQQLGVGRLGEDTARQARGGLMGSDFGAAQTEGTRKYNLQQEDFVLQQQAAAIASIMARANQEASGAVAAKRQAKSEGIASYQNYVDTESERKSAALNRLAKLMILQQVSPDSLDPTQLKQIAKQYGTSDNDIINAYLEEKATQDKDNIGDTEYKTLGKDSYLYDPKTGEFLTPPGADGQGQGGPSEYSIERSRRTITSASQLLKDAKANPGIFGRTAALPIPDAARSDPFRNFKADLQQLKASIAFSELTAMREASKTGGALGQVSNIELGLLESALGALEMSQTPENIQKNLEGIISSIDRFNKAVEQYGGGDFGAIGAGGAGDDVYANEW